MNAFTCTGPYAISVSKKFSAKEYENFIASVLAVPRRFSRI